MLAFLFAPILPVAPFVLLVLLANGTLQGAGPLLVIGFLYAYPVTFVVGLPLYIYSRAKRTVTERRIVKSAAITGTTVGIIVALSFSFIVPILTAIGVIVALGLLGALIGAAVGKSLCWIGGPALTNV